MVLLQIELCRKVIRLYQDIAVSWLLDKGGWEYLLSVLLHHTWTLLTAKDNTLACALANSILKVRQWYPQYVAMCYLVDSADLFPTRIHGDGCKSCSVGPAVASPALPHTLEGGGHAMEGNNIP